MAFRFEAGDAVGDGVRRIAVELVEGARALLAGEGELGVDEAIHESRKSFKRLRALVRLAREPLGKAVYREENRSYRDCGRLLAGARDAAVLVATMDGLAPELELDVGAFARARSALAGEHQSRRDRVVEHTHAHVEVAATLELAAARIDDWALDGITADDLAAGLRRVYRTGRHAMAVAEEDPTAEHLHDWRKRVKYHWHHVELYEGVDAGELGARAKAVHRLADHLGDDHDLHVLAATLLANPSTFGPADDLEPLVRVAEARRSGLQKDAFVLGRELYGERTRDLVPRLTEGLARLTG